MKLYTVKDDNIVDNFQKILLLSFDGKTDVIHFEGFFKDMPNDFLCHKVEISTIGEEREKEYGKEVLGLFI